MAFLELHGVSKGFTEGSARTEVLHDVNLSIERGECVAVVGASGSGKTTLVSLIAGLLLPDQGRITIEGKQVVGPGPDRGVVFQSYALLPWLTVYENVALAVDSVFPHLPALERRARTLELIEMVSLSRAADQRPAELSGGMRQRVAVARALAVDPQILLLDEPLSALDALTRATLQDELMRIWAERKKTLLLITNDIDEAVLLADRIVPLSRGPRARLCGEVRVALGRPRARKALNRDPLFRELRSQVTAALMAETGPRTSADPNGADEPVVALAAEAWS
jgi:nitrate/nitrite transport system ATP-binding protein